MSQSNESIQTAPSLLAYFREELEEAFDQLDVDTSEETEAYLVHLLEGFTRIEPDFAEEVGFEKPAAFYLGEALNSPGDQRFEAYRRLGDASLFNCGFFEGYISRRLVDSEYYQGVGRHAYQELSSLLTFKRSNDMFRGIFEELAEHFEQVVEAFQWLGGSLEDDGIDLSDAFDQQLGPGSSGDAESLQAAGLSFDDSTGSS